MAIGLSHRIAAATMPKQDAPLIRIDEDVVSRCQRLALRWWPDRIDIAGRKATVVDAVLQALLDRAEQDTEQAPPTV